MPKLTEEEMLQNLDFKCARCQAECTKINAAEPEIGYTSKVDGSFVGPLCQACIKEIPEEERAKRAIPETAFLVVIRGDGEGAVITTENIPIPYLRDATPVDAIAACNKVAKDLEEAMLLQKITQRVAMVLGAGQKPSKLVIPGR